MEQISETSLTNRQKYIDDLDQFISHTQTQISTVLQKLSWTPEHFLKPKDCVVCPCDEGHLMPSASLEKHLPTCRLTKLGFQKDEMDVQLHDYKAVYGNNPDLAPVIIDEKILNEILLNHSLKNNSVYYGNRPMPATPQQELATLSRDERLAVYEYVAEKAKRGNEILNVEKDDVLTVDWQAVVKNGGLFKDDNSKPHSYLERLAELRDYKRRRQSYRAKNVHITQKSYTEIIREVIRNQIGILDTSVPDDLTLKSETVSCNEQNDEMKHNKSNSIREENRERRQERNVEYKRSRILERERSVEGRSRMEERERSVEGRSRIEERERSVEGRRNRILERDRNVEGRSRMEERERSVEGRSRIVERERSVEGRRNRILERDRNVEGRSRIEERERSVEGRRNRTDEHKHERSSESSHRHRSKKHKHKADRERSHRHRSKHKKRRHSSRDRNSSLERSTSRDRLSSKEKDCSAQ